MPAIGRDPAVTALPWDSELFGAPAARVDLAEERPASPVAVERALAAAQARYDFVQLLVPAAQVVHVQAAERAGFVVVDLRCELVLDLDGPVPVPPPAAPVIGPVDPAGVAAVAELAAGSHGNSRFGADPALDPARVAELYRRWIRRDASTDGWAVAAAWDAGTVAGYVSFGPRADGDGAIGLIGVAPPARGGGLGGRLLAHAVAALAAGGRRRVTVVTQGGSAPALRMYRTGGFALDRLGYWLHWHRAARGRG